MSPRKLRALGPFFVMGSDNAEIDEVSDSTSSVKTHQIFDAIKPSWPRIHLDVDIPGWFIIMAAVIIGLRGAC